ncbi:MAG: DUF4372 domain-containing protein [Candidatus Hydrogenedentes bacterium]|nr:DUF4372 domain-containing protein [Candidatus Hydrogenedentota bacterium]
MVKTARLFSQLLDQIPRTDFAGIVKKHQGERHARGFTCWTQFVGMLFSQLAHADSLREICNGLACCLGKLVHLGIPNAPNLTVSRTIRNEARSFRGHVRITLL